MKKFEVLKSYTMRSPCMHDCEWIFTVVKRTEKTVTLLDGEKTYTCRINKGASEFNNAETVYPLGRYSMCPNLRAN